MNVFIYIKGECKLVTGGVDCDVTHYSECPSGRWVILRT